MKLSTSLSVVLLISYPFWSIQPTLGQSLSPAPSLATDPPGHRPGGTVQITGTGFPPGELVTLEVSSEPGGSAPLDHPFLLVADETGAIAGEWRIPSTERVGTALHLEATVSSGRSAVTSFMVGPAIKAARLLGREDGEEVQIAGGGFEPGENVIVRVDQPDNSEGASSDYPDSVVVADAEGSLRATLPLMSAAEDSVQIVAVREPMAFAAEGALVEAAQPCPAFLPAVVYPAGSTPSSVAIDDFNQDGKMDLAVGNLHAADVSVFLGNGDGTFQTRAIYTAGSYPAFIHAGDLNRDGIPDLAVANSSSATVSVLLGKGDGTFRPRVTYSVGSEPCFVGAGDFDEDGHFDLLVVNLAAGNISVLRGNGNGTFQPRVNYGVGSMPRAAAITDLDSDGRLDVVVANHNSQFATVLRGNGDGSFQKGPSPVAGYTYSAAAGDFDADGRIDIAMANNGASSISVLRGKGDGTFHPRVIYTTSSSPVSIVTRDFDGDGALDLAVAHLVNPGKVSLLRGIGNGTFEPAQIYPVEGSMSRSLGAADFNGDGKIDLAVANYSSTSVSVLVGNTCSPANLPPIARCKDVTVFAGADCAANASIDDGSFDPEGEAIVLTQSPPGPYATGSTPVTLSVTDSMGAVESCTATVTVIDNTPPTITAPSDVLVVSDPGSCVATEVSLGQPAAADNCAVANISNDFSSPFPLGTTLVTWTAVDPSGNAAQCVQKVTVVGSVQVSLLPPSNKSLKVRSNRVIPIKAALMNCSEEIVTSGVTVWLRVNSTGSNDPREIVEEANGVGIDGTDASDGVMALNDGVYHFNLNTGNIDRGSDSCTVAVIVIDDTTGMVVGTAQTTLQLVKSPARGPE